MKQEMTACDNPDCNRIADEDTIYGWIRGNIVWVGPGPFIEIEVCSAKCLSPGAEAARKRHFENEMVEAHSWHEEQQAAIYSLGCTVCEAQAGDKCITNTGNIKQQPHASRRGAGYRLARERNKT